MQNLASLFLAALLLPSNVAEGRTIDRTVALVNSEVVLQSDLQNFQKNFTLRKELDPFIPLTGFSGSSPAAVLDYLVQERLVAQKFPATDEDVEEEISAIQRNNKIDRERLKEILAGQGVKFDDYRRLMAVSVSKRKLVDRELRPLAAVSDEDVKNSYYTDPGLAARRKEQKLVLSYTIQQLILPSSELAESAQKKLRAGADFDSVASELAAQGAETSRLNNLSEDNMNAKIREAIDGLKVGESTKPIVMGGSYLILRIQEIGAPKDPVFEREKEQIRNQLFQRGLLGQLKLWTERERASSYVHISKN